MDYLKVFVDFVDVIEPLTDAETGRLFRGMLRYAQSGEEPEGSGNERYLWGLAKQIINREAKTLETKRENGKAGGRPRNQEKPNESKGNQEKPNESYKDKDNDKEKDKDNFSSPPGGGEEKDAPAADPGLAKVMNLYLDRVNALPSASCVDSLKNYVSLLGADVCCKAIEVSLDDKKPSWSYIKAILASYHRDGVRSLADVQQREANREAEKAAAEKYRNRLKPSQITAGTFPSDKAVDMDRLREIVDSM